MGEEAAQQKGREDGAGQLGDPVHGGEPRGDPAREGERKGDRRVEVAAGDVSEVRDHDPDREAVRERHGDDVPARDDACPAADEDQREGADELGDAPPESVLVHAGQATEATGRRTRTLLVPSVR